MRQTIFPPESTCSADSLTGVRTPPCAIACIINICAHIKDPVVHVRVRWVMIECVDRRLGSATLWQLAVPGESDSNFPRESKPQWDNTVVEKKSLYMIAAVHQDLLIAFPHDGVPWMPNLRSPLIENPKISKILSFEFGTGLNTALYASASAKTSVFPISTFLDHSTSFPPDSLPHTK